MSAVARWREIEGRMPFVRGRLLAAVPAVLGSVLAVATIVWPVTRISQSSGEPGPDSPDFVQLMWSWGRYEVEGVEVGQEPIVNVAPAYVLGLACLAGVLGGLAWLLRRGPDGRVLGGAGVAFALAVVGSSLLEMVGNLALYGSIDSTGFEMTTLPTGRVEVVASVLLVLALLLMLWRPVVATALSLWAFGARVAARGRERALADEDDERAQAGQPPRVGTAVLRDAGASTDVRRAGDRSSEGVGFSDGAGAEDRFRPPT
ncbi:MAG TPA: hypothetical protein VFN43_06190 [Humibacillus sp.]|nr:hypothetical protein [Humibacillus sp.]